MILPASCTLPSEVLAVSPDPFAAGGYGDVYQGTLNGSRICLKRVRMYTQEVAQKTLEARGWTSLPPVSLTGFTDLLPGGRNVETLKSSERLTLSGCHCLSLPAHFELDVRRGSAGVHKE